MTEQNGLERSSATDELRRLLDGRGVEWTEPNNKARSHTTYWTAGALRCMAVEFTDGVVSISSLSHDLTPEQAVEATLGSDLQAENAKLREQIETLVMYVEADGTRYWVDDDGNQHFDHSNTVKDDADKLRELVRELYDELDAATQYDAGGGRGVVYEFADRMRELGVDA